MPAQLPRAGVVAGGGRGEADVLHAWLTCGSTLNTSPLAMVSWLTWLVESLPRAQASLVSMLASPSDASAVAGRRGPP